MRHMRLLIVALTMVMALSALIASAAQAEPKVKGTFPDTVTASGGAGKLVAGSNEIKCKANTVAGEVESATLGHAVIKWTGCENPEAVGCKSLAEGESEAGAAKEIIVNLHFHFVLLIFGGHLYWLLWLVGLVLITCGVVNIDIKGNVLGLTTLEEGVAATGTTQTFEGSGGKQDATSCEEGTESLCSENPIELLSEFVEGTPESSVLEQVDSVTFATALTAEG